MTGQEVWDEIAVQCHWTGRVLRTDVALPIVDGRRESWLESYAAVLFDEWGIDPPTPQLVVRDSTGAFVARVDAGWEDDATVLELDGRQKYLLPQAVSDDTPSVDPHAAFTAEKARYDALGNLGLERVRFGLTDLLTGRPWSSDGSATAGASARATGSPGPSSDDPP